MRLLLVLLAIIVFLVTWKNVLLEPMETLLAYLHQHVLDYALLVITVQLVLSLSRIIPAPMVIMDLSLVSGITHVVVFVRLVTSVLHQVRIQLQFVVVVLMCIVLLVLIVLFLFLLVESRTLCLLFGSVRPFFLIVTHRIVFFNIPEQI